jgi:hypothetical protein
MKLITFEDYNKKLKEYVYLKNRWSYFSEVVNFLKGKDRFKKILELGPLNFPICKDSDTVDIVGEPTFNFDLNNRHWPFKHYDLIIALQVLEHLEDQKHAFQEIKRLSDFAIISLPYKWKTKVLSHNGIDEEVIKKWTNNEPIFKKVIAKSWIILFYDYRNNKN